MFHQAATPLGQVRTELRAMLKSDVAIDPLAPPTPGSFRNFISRTWRPRVVPAAASRAVDTVNM